MSYAVVWSEDGAPVSAGRLELQAGIVILEGLRRRTLLIDSLADVRIERHPEKRLRGRPTLVLDAQGGPSVRITSVADIGSLGELAERIAASRIESKTDRVRAASAPDNADRTPLG
jgi:hypothetical protein